MSLVLPIALATVLSLLSYATMARLFLVPAMKKWSLSVVLVVLLWPHTFRFVALSIFSAIEFGGVHANVADVTPTIYGDTASAILSLIAIWVIASGSRVARPVVWGAALLGTIDLFQALPDAFVSGLAGNVSGFTWAVVVLLVPSLLVSYALLFWQLVARRDEPISPIRMGA